MFGRLILAAVAVAALACAQDTGGGDMGGGMGGRGGGGAGGGMGGMGGGGGMGRTQKPTKADQMITKLKLNKDQTREFETILQGAAQDSGPLRQQLAQARNAMAGFIIDGKPEESEKVLKEYANLQTQMTALEVKAFQKVYATLKPNQTAHAGEAFDLMGGIFDIQSSGGRMGRGGFGGGGDMGGGGGRGRGR